MAEFAVFLYAMLAMAVTTSLHRDRKAARPSSPMLTMAGWSLFSLSSTLAVLMAALAVALAFGATLPGVDPAVISG